VRVDGADETRPIVLPGRASGSAAATARA
jgi:hypothetical protein